MQPHASFFESLFKRELTADNNLAFLKETANKYPFFAPVHFYLLNNVKQDPELYSKQATKTAILFNNPFWLNFQLEQSFTKDISTINETKETIRLSEENNIIHEEMQETFSATETNQMKFMTPEIKETTTDSFVFEPLYTSDYFASQGIKLSDEVQPMDKLGMQLKSFTEWLKTMKKIQTNQHAQPIDVQTDESIQTLAEKSNQEEVVVTEAMAEVLEQQGLNKKAVQVYQKLSLLNPAKSTYFAAKIDQLKES